MSATHSPSELEHAVASSASEAPEHQEASVQGTQQRPRPELTSIAPALTVLALQFASKDLPLLRYLQDSLGNGSH
jgi:hypothetical protein